MVRLRCPNCGYEWEYRGKHVYATCPSCLRRVHTERFAVERGEGAEGGGQRGGGSGGARKPRAAG
jgi:tRNA(Ile2) C34 agmatinyltransferase TiaS